MEQRRNRISFRLYESTRDICEKSTDCVEVSINNHIWFRTWRTISAQTFPFHNTLKSNL